MVNCAGYKSGFFDPALKTGKGGIIIVFSLDMPRLPRNMLMGSDLFIPLCCIQQTCPMRVELLYSVTLKH